MSLNIPQNHTLYSISFILTYFNQNFTTIDILNLGKTIEGRLYKYKIYITFF